jgi:RNA methyltransferase, TrmH family
VLAAISPVRTPSGVVAIAQRAPTPLDEALARPPQLVLMLGGIQDAGNVGAIVRAADAFGATGIVAAEGTADPLGWKALRGAMGSSFRVPIAIRQSLAAAVGAARQAGLRILAAVPRGGTWLHDCDLRPPFALVLGAEGAGVPAAVTAGADEQITIAMRERVESLNVAVAAAVILYEAARQRAAPGVAP